MSEQKPNQYSDEFLSENPDWNKNGEFIAEEVSILNDCPEWYLDLVHKWTNLLNAKRRREVPLPGLFQNITLNELAEEKNMNLSDF